jgi:2-oxoglutarate ferredoxin oxidoreductase subunit alpha
MEKQEKYLDGLTIRFAGDSGDGMQLSGTQFSNTSGAMGNYVNTFPDYPAEIRAPEGTLYGVSAYQIQIATKEISTFGAFIDVLVAMNASSLKVSLPKLSKGAVIIANESGFGAKNLKLAEYETNPLEDGSLSDFEVHSVPIVETMKEVCADLEMSPKFIERTKNLFALGIVYALYSRDSEHTIKWLNEKFGKKPVVLDANLRALKKGMEYTAVNDEFTTIYKVEKSEVEPGFYRNITGNEAAALGLVIAANRANMHLFLGSYPITPATEILHFISGYKKHGVKHLQAEDEIAGITRALGASFGGYLAATTTSGPGLSLKVEAMGLACILELPLVIIDVQRAGPSTGIPTKPEQTDLLMAMYGRHGDAPIPIVAATDAADCFNMTIEAARIALKYMTPVILLTDGYIAQGTNAFKVPHIEDIPEMSPTFATDPETYQSYKRDPETLARMWAVPGTQGLEHRIGGLEKEDITGNVSSDSENHQLMTNLRQAKVIPLLQVHGEQSGDLLILGWGGTYGAIKDAWNDLRCDGKVVSRAHLKYLNPFPANIEEVLNNFDRVLIPELNMGDLKMMIQGKFLKRIIGLNRVDGLPLQTNVVYNKVVELLESKEG